jgi:N-acetylneuraminic acid mutarotase
LPNIIHSSNCIFQNEKKIYYFAVTEGTTYSASNKIYEATIFSDGKIRKFTQTNLVFPVTGINACSMIVYKNKVFTFGGTGAGLINKIFCIDIDSNGNLTKITEINSFISLYATTSIVIGNFLYIIGGSSANGTRDSNIYKATLTVGWGLYSDSVYNNSPELYKYTTNLNLFNSNPILQKRVPWNR